MQVMSKESHVVIKSTLVTLCYIFFPSPTRIEMISLFYVYHMYI